MSEFPPLSLSNKVTHVLLCAISHGPMQMSKVFVRNLSYSCTASELEAAFSAVGPIKQCFVVTKPGTTECRGFGYVIFAMKEVP